MRWTTTQPRRPRRKGSLSNLLSRVSSRWRARGRRKLESWNGCWRCIGTHSKHAFWLIFGSLHNPGQGGLIARCRQRSSINKSPITAAGQTQSVSVSGTISPISTPSYAASSNRSLEETNTSRTSSHWNRRRRGSTSRERQHSQPGMQQWKDLGRT